MPPQRKRGETTAAANFLHLIKTDSIRHHAGLLDNPSYTISSVSPTAIDNDDVVTVAFNSLSPSKSDWIGAYSPPDVNISLTSPVKFGFCDMGEGDYLTTGAGQLTFNMTNLRAGIKFYYFINGTDTPVQVASSTDVVNFNNINEPLRNRIVPTGDPNIYQLLWSSNSSSSPVLRWGTQTKVYSNVVPAVTVRVERSELCGAPANASGWRDLGAVYKANISGILESSLSNKQIYYVFGDAAGTMSEEVVFLVPPQAGTQPPTRPTTVVLMADLGVGSTDTSYDTNVWNEACPPAVNTSMSIGDRVARGTVDAVFLSGDIAYADGFLSSWDFFLDMLSPVAGKSLFLSTVGNHESDWPGTATGDLGDASGGECGVVSTALLPMPAPAVTDQPWWSYDVGIIHFVGMSTEHNYTVGSPQYLWLEQDLAGVNRTRTPWVVFSGHRPMYVDSSHCCPNYNDDDCAQCTVWSDMGGMQALQENVEPLLFKYQVNLGFSGHFHQAQRQSAVYQNTLVQSAETIYNADGQPVAFHSNPHATVWMVIGSAGNGPDYANVNFTWSERYWNNLWGYAVVTAVNSTYLYWELVNSANDQVVDRMAITQNFQAWQPTDNGGDSGDNGLSDTELGITVAFSVVGAVCLLALLVKFVLLPALHGPGPEDKKALRPNVEMNKASKDAFV